jgi:tRNA-splicing ligase RtcB
MAIKDKLYSMIPMEEIEQSAQTQIYDVLALPCLKKLAIMPDVHAGYDLVIGGVALLDDHISPSFVGYDIGCGMVFVSTGVKTSEIFPDERAKVELFHKIQHSIPSGFSCRKDRDYGFPKFKSAAGNKDLTVRVNDKVESQSGTLGGGNHFIEIGENLAGEVCITIHSGSRNAGHTIGGFYMKMGRLFPLGSLMGQAYLQDMDYALQFALYNRELMLREVLALMKFKDRDIKRIMAGMVNENHNHAVVTPEGVLHRKGATPADLGQFGIIPANMRDGVYITRGLGNQEYLSSASHGCGRRMGRKEAKRSLDLGEFKAQMAGIVSTADKNVLDEAPGAYKDINEILSYQQDVVIEVIDFVKPLINVKAQGD